MKRVQPKNSKIDIKDIKHFFLNAFLVCASHKEPIVAFDFDQLYLKKYLEILRS